MAASDRPFHAALAGALLCLSGTALAETGSAHGDIQGVWKIATPVVALKPLSGPVPFTAKGRAEYDANKMMQAKGDFDDYDITTSRCSSPGVPRLMLTPQRFKIWPRGGYVIFDFAWNRAIRQIDARGITPERPLVPTMTGTSSAHWEGRTLVATTTDISERTLLDDLLPHSVDMTVTERIRLLDPNTLEDGITINDPAYYTKPWDAVITYKRQPDAIFAEDVCMDRLPKRTPAVPS